MIDMDKAVLLVVDAQNGFVNEHSAHVIPVIRDLAERWSSSGRPTIWTRYRNYVGSPYETLIGWRALYGPPDTDIDPELAPLAARENAYVLDKVTYTALTSEGQVLLQELGATHLVICGIATDGCVLKTALDAFDLGYTPWIVEDAVASNATRHVASEIHNSALLHLSRLIGSRQLLHLHDVEAAISRIDAA